ncbi:hypothetical protein U9M48_021823 [Paspalum notatum var. saurae]|uniref:Uncharacterized protein n=1 Tax=Paspalum notatum var. saurae TaxID=547442 RepID=A0AAQ3WTC7_PASNO
MSGGVSGVGRAGWSPFDAIRNFPSTPESLMSQIDAAIASTEYARACALLDPAPASASSPAQPTADGQGEVGAPAPAPPCYDAKVADEAYRAASAALGAGRPDAAVRSLRVALASCPPEKAAAVAKVRSMLAIASAQLHKQQHQAQQSRSSTPPPGRSAASWPPLSFTAHYRLQQTLAILSSFVFLHGKQRLARQELRGAAWEEGWLRLWPVGIASPQQQQM